MPDKLPEEAAFAPQGAPSGFDQPAPVEVTQADTQLAADIFSAEQPTITQADRDAAEAVYPAFLASLKGEDGGYGLAEGFARHRTTSLAAQDGLVERIRNDIINTPETADFIAGVAIEATHQRERWGSEHDAGKTPFDWFWLVGYLAQKAAASQVNGDTEKAMHHTISTAAALANWHAAISGASTAMRPGIEPPSALQGRVESDLLQDALANAYAQGATDVHNSWVDGTNGSEPDFGEAASDYAHRWGFSFNPKR